MAHPQSPIPFRSFSHHRDRDCLFCPLTPSAQRSQTMSDQQPRPRPSPARRSEPDPPPTRARFHDLPDHLVRLRRHPARRRPLRARSPGTSTPIMNPTVGVLEQRSPTSRADRRRRHRPARPVVTYSGAEHLPRRRQHRLRLSQLYGGTYNLFAHTPRSTASRCAGPTLTTGRGRRPVDEKTRLVFAETIGNPRLNVVDIPAWSGGRACRRTAADPRQHRPDARSAPRVRPRRRHRRALADEVHRRPRHVDRRRGRRLRQVRLGRHKERYPGSPSRPELPRRRLERRASARRVHRPRPDRAAAQHRAPRSPVQRVPSSSRASRRCRCGMERHNVNALPPSPGTSSTTPTSKWVYYPGLDSSDRAEVADRVLDGGYGALVTFGIKGGAGRQAPSSR